MRAAQALLIAALGFGLTGCPLRKTPVAKSAPPAPKPAPAPTPPPPPEPLSIPQTNVQLAPPQPLSPEAIASTQLPGESAPAPATAPRTPPGIRPRGQQPSRAATEPATTTPSMPPAVQPPPVETEVRQPITEVLSPAEQRRLQEDAATRAQEAQRLVDQLPAGRRNQQRNSVARVETFLKQAREAEARGDMRQANELAGRALVLARELRP